MENVKGIIESLLFVSDTPLSEERIRRVLDHPDTTEIKEAIARLNEEYEARNSGICLREVAGGYQLRTRSEHGEWIRRFLQPNPKRLSKAALETLAIIAYKQPIIRSDIEHIRGVDCGGVIRMLLERKLIRILGRREIPGRPLIYSTTKEFLEIFDLKNLKDLPTLKEIDAFGNPVTGMITPPPPATDIRPEAPGVQGAAPDDQSDTPDDQAEALDDQSETPDDQAEAPDDQSETPDDQAETPDDQAEAPDDQSETPDDQAETPDDQAEAPDDQSETTDDQAEAPDDQAKAPMVSEEAPEVQGDTPDEQSEVSDHQAEAPSDQTEAPEAQTDINGKNS